MIRPQSRLARHLAGVLAMVGAVGFPPVTSYAAREQRLAENLAKLEALGGEREKIERLAEVAGLSLLDLTEEMVRMIGAAGVQIDAIDPEKKEFTVSALRTAERPLPVRDRFYVCRRSTPATRRLVALSEQEPRPAEHRQAQKSKRRKTAKRRKRRGY